jgi:protein TonB
VRSLLTQYLNYPPRARKRGWEGEVLVGFRVDADGRLGNVHLARSSGYSLLDESALAALSRIGIIPLTGSPHFTPMELQLPVLYQLREG